VTRRQGRKRKKLLDEVKDRRGYRELKEEALDRTMWRNRLQEALDLSFDRLLMMMFILKRVCGDRSIASSKMRPPQIAI
jgi:hypothetical protein